MIAICVGHSRGDGGAISSGGVSEWNFNSLLAADVVQILETMGYDAIRINRYKQAGYTTAMTDLARTLAAKGATVAVELHFNSADSPAANGHEWLYWHSSVAGRALARCLQSAMCLDFPKAKSRGLVDITSEAGRGGAFLRRTECPAVICEPFFGSNPVEWEAYSTHRLDLANVIATGIDRWVKGGGR